MEPLTPTEVRAMIGPEPPGDPGAMRALAGQLRRAARLLDARADIRLDNWESPAGRRVKAAIQGAAGRASGAVRQLQSAASLLEREADEVTAQQVRWAARYSALINQGSSIPATKI
jgi:Tfp pilus assembly protein PilW